MAGSFNSASGGGTVAYSATVTLDDGHGGVDTRTLPLSVVDASIWANPDLFAVAHGLALISGLGVLANDRSAGGTLAASLVSAPAHGSLALNADGTFRYAPGAGYTGADSFAYSASDGLGHSATATASINVINPHAPTGVADTYSVAHGSSLSVAAEDGVLSNDEDGIDALTATLSAGPSHGSLSFNPDGSFLYTPSAGYIGADSFTYALSDGLLSGPLTTANVSVTNAAPQASGDSFAVQPGVALTAGLGVLANDTDPEGDALTASLVSGPSHGTLTLNADGTFVYTPSAGYTGADSFGYSASDGLLSATATATLNVHPSNAAPSVSAETYHARHDHALTVAAADGVLANDSDADGDALRASLVSGPSHGTLSLSPGGAFVFTPSAGFEGADSFAYSVGDGLANTTATATVSVFNLLPSLGNQSGVEGQEVFLDFSCQQDIGDATLSYSAVGLPSGVEIVEETGEVWGTLGFDAAGTHTVTVSVSDGSGTDSHTFTWTVAGSTLTANDDVFETTHDQALSASVDSGVLGNDLSEGSASLTASLVSGPAHGTLSLSADGSFLYTPDAGYWGEDSFTYSVSDGSASSTASVALSVVEEAPVAQHGWYRATHGLGLSVSAENGILADASDADGDSLSITLVSGPSHGTLTLNADGSFLYTPDIGHMGDDFFTYSLGDGLLTSGDTTVFLETGNAPPSVRAVLYGVQTSVGLSVAASYGLLARASDPEGAPLTAGLVSGPSHGTLSLSPDGGFVYSPSAGYDGIDEFVFRVSDGALSATAAASLLAHTINLAPWANDDSFSALHDRANSFGPVGVLRGDGDPDGDPLTASFVSGPSHGTLSLAANGSFAYTPNSGFSGTDSFCYVVSDGLTSSGTATVTLAVLNEAPLAESDSYTAGHNASLSVASSLGLLSNDTDPEEDGLTASLVAGPAHGTLTLGADGSFVYTPDSGYSGADSFSYSASDGTNSTTATVALTVKPANSAPTATNDMYTLAYDWPLGTDETDGLLANDADADGDSLTASLVSGPSHGTLTLNADGTFLYTPDAGYVGPDSFVYSVSDGLLSTTATASLTATNAAPTASDDLFSVLGSGNTTIDRWWGLLANDSDADGDELSATLVSSPSHGSVSLGADGSFVYAPDVGFTGADSFTYLVGDGLASSGTATAVLTTAPVALDDGFGVQQGQTLDTSAEFGALWNDGVATGASLTASLVSGPGHGTLSFAADGSFLYTPDAGYMGEDSFTYCVTAGGVGSNTATVSLSVLDEAPVADGGADYLIGGGAWRILRGDLNEFATDADGDTLSFSVIGGPAHGSLSLNADGTFDYRPGRGFVGADSFTYQVSDGALSSGTATLALQVTNEAPVAVDVDYDVADGTLAATGSLSLLDTAAYDTDGDALRAALVNGPSHAASFALYADGTFNYTPEEGFEGEDSFAFQVGDGVFASEQATVTLHVSKRPIAHGDVFFAAGSGPLLVSADHGLLANDVAAHGGELTVELVSAPTSGELVLGIDGRFLYKFANKVEEAVWFTYKVLEQVDDVYWSSRIAVVNIINAPPMELRAEAWSGKKEVLIKKDIGVGEYSREWNAGDASAPLMFIAGARYELTMQFKMEISDTELDLHMSALGRDWPHIILPEYLADGDAQDFSIYGLPDSVVYDKATKQFTVIYKDVRAPDVPQVRDGVKSDWEVSLWDTSIPVPFWGDVTDHVPLKNDRKFSIYVTNDAQKNGRLPKE